MALHNEIEFENEICDYLAAHGWLYEEKAAENYERALALYPTDVVAWVQESDPDAWAILTKNHGASAESTLLKRLRDSLNQAGTLSVLRNGFDVLGLRKPLKMAQFKPALAMNPDIVKRYEANRLRVVRQVHYSVHNELNIDLVLFLNGIPIATVELKTDNTQSIDDAVYQYKKDRNPKPKGQAPEPLLTFPSGALVHFAVSSSRVMMTTKLAGFGTTFLPFDQGDNGAAGNPLNPKGHRTAYLWEQVWQRDSLLEILGRYMVAERNDKKQITKLIFPRFHQLDATRKLLNAVLVEGAGEKYLIQHSAGSGKTNSIAWSAHFLADLHDADNKKVFDTVLVVSDRKVIDGQLQEVIDAFERTAGVVATIRGDKGSKSAELAEALSGDKKIVVCTIQTFPFALEMVRELAAAEGKQFAVIADEAHSSQSGEAASKLKQVLSDAEAADLADGGTVSSEDILAANMEARAADTGITFVAFTATPKAKTLELFGRRPDPSQASSEGNLPLPFHVYSMQQAIEEGFILDVLKNYTSYDLAFKLAKAGEEFEDTEVDRSAATKGLMNWVRLHPYNIAQKVQVVVEHYRETIQPLLEGKAKAMVVVSSRLEAVRWQVAINKYIKEKAYPLRTLVAFSGEVNDKETGPDPFKETSSEMNPDLKGQDIREAFKDDQYQILLVANKFQTGFDQPLLCGMYVDKRLAGIQAVQTLSRLNRFYPGKTDTYVLDFVNHPQEILDAFKTYFTTAQLSDTTDPNLILDLRSKLDALGYYDEFEIDRVVEVVLNPKAKQSQLEAALTPVADRLLKQFAAAK
ncbi:type I restriction endonuclease, partial [bacterium]|nr:type I restriction endonuclease [bacterium]